MSRKWQKNKTSASPAPRGVGGESNNSKTKTRTDMDISAWATLAVIFVILTALQKLAPLAGPDEEKFD